MVECAAALGMDEEKFQLLRRARQELLFKARVASCTSPFSRSDHDPSPKPSKYHPACYTWLPWDHFGELAIIIE
jgi:hypothetical protein